ncbi:MAG: hypothetical protein ACLPID_05345 [Beijerinckiaceae bacterium]
MPEGTVPNFPLSKRWNVAKLTSAISSSPNMTACNGSPFCDGISLTDIFATDPLVDAAKVAPAIPSTVAALLGRFTFEESFA